MKEQYILLLQQAIKSDATLILQEQHIFSCRQIFIYLQSTKKNVYAIN